jgi:hypothetical protein
MRVHARAIVCAHARIAFYFYAFEKRRPRSRYGYFQLLIPNHAELLIGIINY